MNDAVRGVDHAQFTRGQAALARGEGREGRMELGRTADHHKHHPQPDPPEAPVGDDPPESAAVALSGAFTT
jgi:hypothetical protein